MTDALARAREFIATADKADAAPLRLPVMCDSAVLREVCTALIAAEDEVERLKHDMERLYTSLNAEVNAAESQVEAARAGEREAARKRILSVEVNLDATCAGAEIATLKRAAHLVAVGRTDREDDEYRARGQGKGQ